MPSMKRGLAPIIITVLLVAITLVATSIVWMYVKPTLLSPQDSCLNIQLQQDIAISSVCYDESSKETRLLLTREFESMDVTMLAIELTEGITKKAWYCSPACGTCVILQPGQRKTYYLPNEAENPPVMVSILLEGCPVDTRQIKKC